MSNTFSSLNEALKYIETDMNMQEQLSNMGISNINKNFSCLNPNHPDKNPSMSYNKKNNTVHCFSCLSTYNLIDLIRLETNLDGASLYEFILKKYGITVTKENKNKKATPYYHNLEAAKNDYTAYIEKCHLMISKTDYFEKRGLNKKTLDRFNLGYDESKKAIIFPYNSQNTYYSSRKVNPQDKRDRFYKPSILQAGEEPLFNAEALYTSKGFTFIVEAQICALTLEQEHIPTCALCSTSNTDKLIEQIKKKPTQNTLVLVLDNDTAGKKSEKKLIESLELINHDYITVNFSGIYNDPNEAYTSNKQYFLEQISLIQKNGIKQYSKIKNKTEYISQHKEEIEKDLFFIKNNKTEFIKTGFSNLDSALDGGLTDGLYVLGAVSSIGKTTLVLQMANQIAKQGNDVILFSLEISKHQLIAKSISRLSYEYSKISKDIKPKTMYDILKKGAQNCFQDNEKTVMDKIFDDYKNLAERFYINEGIGDINVSTIKDYIYRHINKTQNKPVVMIDYLQIIPPKEMRATDKQNMDRTIYSLKQLTRELSIPIFTISSFSRENYTMPVDLKSFKESGGIEYSGDVLLGLQYTGMDYLEDETDRSRQIRIRNLIHQNERNAFEGIPVNVTAKILKNRNQAKNSVQLHYLHKYNIFEEKTSVINRNIKKGLGKFSDDTIANLPFK